MSWHGLCVDSIHFGDVHERYNWHLGEAYRGVS